MYDSANQLIRENNQQAGKTWTWSYDSAGNILSKSEYDYTTGTLGTPIDTVTYTYGDSDWGDLLTGYDGRTVTSDEIGNMLSDGVHTYTWEHGRQLASMDSWTFQYDAGGMRTRRYDSETGTAYTYRYSDGLLRQMIISSEEVIGSFTFRYDNTGKPISFCYDLTDEENAVSYSGEVFYVVNVQGDVIGLISEEMDSIGSYTYDAWGVVKSVQVYDDAFELVVNLNPLRYRGYVYDVETGLYYLQSRYYNPEMGRFINADVYVATGQGFVGNNMFAYCLNNPVICIDKSGKNTAIADMWATTMWWLCGVDTALPIGDAIYLGGIILLGAITYEVGSSQAQDYVSEKDEVVATPPSPNPNNDDDDDLDDDYYNNDDNFGGRSNVGKQKGETPRNNRSQNRQFRDATRRLSPKVRRQIHDEITGQGFGYHEIEELAGLFDHLSIKPF